MTPSLQCKIKKFKNKQETLAHIHVIKTNNPSPLQNKTS
jgi:hypothetical protein